MRSQRFKQKVGDFLKSIEPKYGEFISAEVASVWRPESTSEYDLYRVQAVFTKGNLVDVRVLINRQNSVVGLFYYYPWKNTFNP